MIICNKSKLIIFSLNIYHLHLHICKFTNPDIKKRHIYPKCLISFNVKKLKT